MQLEQILESDFNDAILAGLSEDEMAGIIEAAPAKAKRKLAKKIKATASTNTIMAASTPTNSRGELTKRYGLLPQSIQQGLANRTMQASDATIYALKSVGGAKSAKMFKDDDNKVVGICNISSGKLEKGNIFLLSEVILQSGETAQEADAGSTANFGIIANAIRNGELELRVNGANVLSQLSTEMFNSTGNNRKHLGSYRLDNPKMIFDQQAIELNLEWNTPAPAKTWVKAILKGTIVMKN